MKLLLGTHVLIWLVEGNDSLTQVAKEAIESEARSDVKVRLLEAVVLRCKRLLKHISSQGDGNSLRLNQVSQYSQ
jgi:PIN domain nuclease of toxin-antitoxin system